MSEKLQRPHFVIIGAMKCATSTLHDQLARQPGVSMSTPKEPNFFSDDTVWDRGVDWYRSLWRDAPEGSRCGESSTHYTKLPTHPDACARMYEMLPDARLVYVMRDPIDRVVSHYMHAWSVREVTEPIDRAVRGMPALVDYSRYAMQLDPWIERYGRERVLPVFFERLTRDPHAEFERICRFLGVAGGSWDDGLGAKNVSSERQIAKPKLDRFLDVGVVRTVRRTLLPESLRERIKSRWRMEQRPVLGSDARAWLCGQLDPDLAHLGAMLGLSLSCDGFSRTVLASDAAPEWADGGAACRMS